MKKITALPLLLFAFALSQISGSAPWQNARADDQTLLDKCLNSNAHECLYIKETNEIVRVARPFSSPFGTAFETNDGTEKIIVSGAEGENETVLLERPKSETITYALVDASGDGKNIYFSDNEPSNLGGAYIFGGVYGGLKKLDRNTGNITQVLTQQETGAIYNVSPNNQWVVYETFIGPNQEGVVYYYPKLDKIPVDFNGLILKNLETNMIRSIEHRPSFQRFGNAIFSPSAQKMAYEEERGPHPDDRQYDVVIENVAGGSERSIFPNCNLAANEWGVTSPWVDDQYLLIRCLKKPNEFEGDFYLIDTHNSNEKKPVELTDEMKKWNVNKYWLWH